LIVHELRIAARGPESRAVVVPEGRTYDLAQELGDACALALHDDLAHAREELLISQRERLAVPDPCGAPQARTEHAKARAPAAPGGAPGRGHTRPGGGGVWLWRETPRGGRACPPPAGALASPAWAMWSSTHSLQSSSSVRSSRSRPAQGVALPSRVRVPSASS